MYDIVMAILAVIAVAIAFLDIAGKLPPVAWIGMVEGCIWLIFVVDYVVRLIPARDKRKFFKENIFDLVAILPFSSFLRAFRLAKVFRLTKLARFTKMTKFVKLFAFFGRFGEKAKKFLTTNGLIYVLYANVIVIVLGAVGIYFAEGGVTVDSFPDSLWWSFVTATTVGYSDIYPATAIGKWIAVALMVVGIGTMGMLTGTLATYFIKVKKEEPNGNEKEVLIREIEALSPEQVSLLKELVNQIKK